MNALTMLGTIDEMASQRAEEALVLAPTAAPQETVEMLLAESEFLDEVGEVIDALIVEVRTLRAIVDMRDTKEIPAVPVTRF